MTETTFAQAFDHLRRYADQPEITDDALVRLLDAEAVILDHAPRNHREASIVIGVLIDNLKTGVRSDGRDVRALAALRTWVANVGSRDVAA